MCGWIISHHCFFLSIFLSFIPLLFCLLLPHHLMMDGRKPNQHNTKITTHGTDQHSAPGREIPSGLSSDRRPRPNTEGTITDDREWRFFLLPAGGTRMFPLRRRSTSGWEEASTSFQSVRCGREDSDDQCFDLGAVDRWSPDQRREGSPSLNDVIWSELDDWMPLFIHSFIHGMIIPEHTYIEPSVFCFFSFISFCVICHFSQANNHIHYPPSILCIGEGKSAEKGVPFLHSTHPFTQEMAAIQLSQMEGNKRESTWMDPSSRAVIVLWCFWGHFVFCFCLMATAFWGICIRITKKRNKHQDGGCSCLCLGTWMC